jgi:hypothetical protein
MTTPIIMLVLLTAPEFWFENRTFTARSDAIAVALSAAGCGDGSWLVASRSR